jgi:hypothetical protein
VRRTGRGWPSILILALAYGVLEEGIVTMSLFNPNYVGLRLLDHGYIPQLGIGGPWTALVLTLHVVWSISVPIATVEALAYGRRTTPWLGRLGLALTAVVFVAGAIAMTAFSIADSQFVASLPQLLTSGVVAAVLAGGRSGRRAATDGRARRRCRSGPKPLACRGGRVRGDVGVQDAAPLLASLAVRKSCARTGPARHPWRAVLVASTRLG